MSRPNSRWLILPALMLAVVAVACGGGGEEKTLLNKYFMASKVSDNMTLSNIATVLFDPRSDGQMMSFDIVSVSEPKVTPLTIKQDAEALAAAMEEEKAFTAKKTEYQDANTEAIDRIIKAEGRNQPVRGRDAEIQKEWNKWREQTAEHAKKVSEARQRVAEHQPIVEISCQDQRNPIDTTAYDGEVVSKDVTIDGQVRTDAGTSAKKYVFTLQRVTLKNVNGQDLVGRWVITDRKDAQ